MHNKGRFTLWPKVESEAVDFHQSNCKKSKSVASQPFTLRPKSKSHCNLKCLLFDKGDGLSKEVWVDGNGDPNYGQEAVDFFSWKKSIIGKILAVRLEGLFWARNKVGYSSGFGLWAWPLEASHHARPKAPLLIFYWLFSAHFFGLSTKFGNSIPQPLDLDSHSVKRPQDISCVLEEFKSK
jgi:hypothetical protein